MEAEVKKNSLKSRIIKTEPIDWRALRFIQQDKFKDLDLSARHRLKSSLVANNFSQPFYVWEDEEDLSNMSWDNFSEQYGEIIRQSVDMLKDKSPAEFEAHQLRHDIYELQRHISVIEML